MNHPSFFALDAYLLEPRAGEVETHLQTCAQCQAHLASLRVRTPLPPKLAQLEAPKRTPWWPLLFAAAAVVIGVVTFGTQDPPPQLTAKGTPATALWLNRGGKVIGWNGQPLRAGDTLRFELAPAGFTYVTVYDEHTREVLYEAQVPEGPPTLTPAWQFDGAAATESLRVVLSRGPLPADALQAEGCTQSSVTHCTRFTLTRAGP